MQLIVGDDDNRRTTDEKPQLRKRVEDDVSQDSSTKEHYGINKITEYDRYSRRIDGDD